MYNKNSEQSKFPNISVDFRKTRSLTRKIFTSNTSGRSALSDHRCNF